MALFQNICSNVDLICGSLISSVLVQIVTRFSFKHYLQRFLNPFRTMSSKPHARPRPLRLRKQLYLAFILFWFTLLIWTFIRIFGVGIRTWLKELSDLHQRRVQAVNYQILKQRITPIALFKHSNIENLGYPSKLLQSKSVYLTTFLGIISNICKCPVSIWYKETSMVMKYCTWGILHFYWGSTAIGLQNPKDKFLDYLGPISQ